MSGRKNINSAVPPVFRNNAALSALIRLCAVRCAHPMDYVSPTVLRRERRRHRNSALSAASHLSLDPETAFAVFITAFTMQL